MGVGAWMPALLITSWCHLAKKDFKKLFWAKIAGMQCESTARCGLKSSTSLRTGLRPFQQLRISPLYVQLSLGGTQINSSSTFQNRPKKSARFHLLKGAKERHCKIFATQIDRPSSKPRRLTIFGS